MLGLADTPLTPLGTGGGLVARGMPVYRGARQGPRCRQAATARVRRGRYMLGPSSSAARCCKAGTSPNRCPRHISAHGRYPRSSLRVASKKADPSAS